MTVATAARLRITSDRFVRGHLLAALGIVCVTAYFSYAFFHNDEYFQIIGYARAKLGTLDPRTLPWEYDARMRPWMQPGLYYLIGRALGALGVENVFTLTLFFRLVTGVIGWIAMAAFLETSLPWFSKDEQRVHVRIVTLLGFMPYLLVRTSSESLAMSAFTLGFCAVVAGADASGTGASPARSVRRLALAGVLFGLAFEFRFQTALLVIGLLVWMRFVAKMKWSAVGIVTVLSLGVVALAAPVDAWGYGEWVFPPLAYLRVNLFEGAAVGYGTDPPFAYVYLLVANIFLPIAVVLVFAMGLTYYRHRRHAVTWTTLPFVLVHCVLAHKEERFIFPILLVGTSFVVLAFGPSTGRPIGWVSRLWARRSGFVVKILVAWNFAGMVVLALHPIGWNHHVPFYRFVDERLGGEIHAYSFIEDVPGMVTVYMPRVLDLEPATPAEVARALQDGTAKEYLVADTPRLKTGIASVDGATLVYSEFPFWRSASVTALVMDVVDRYNESARMPLRPVHWRSVYRLSPIEGPVGEGR